ncbi:MAG: helix-turn-helix domain-containing protein [Acidobacteria bacterium]|nr:helix-turn-helix domain-containing protein [Acidobacteriota bacterium]
MDTMPAFDQLQLRFVDHIQWRYEVIRPLVLFDDRTATQRAAETHTHPETVRKLTRRFRHQGTLGLFPGQTEIPGPRRGQPIPAVVVEELTRLKALYQDFGYRELARIMHYTCNERIDDKTIQKLWQQTPGPVQGVLPLGTSQSQEDRAAVRRQVIQLYAQGWSKGSISAFLHVSRPTVALWIRRFEAAHGAGLEDKSHAPTSPARKVWLPLMIEVYHLQKRHPDAGRFRIWSLLARDDISVRTVGRVMALNKQVYDDIPHVARQRRQNPPQPHPYKAAYPHQYWFIDGRQMDFALDDVKWWSLILLDGYSRTMLAGAVAPVEASWVTLMVLYTACLRYGVPQHLISDSGGAFTSNDVTAVLQRLQIVPNPLLSTQGESYKNLMETHFNIQRRLYDYQFSLTTTPAEFEQAHQAFMALYNTTAHEGLLRDGFRPPIPLQVLGEAKGRICTPEDLARRFSRALFPRTTNQYGCVTLHSYHFYVEAGLPQTRVLLWVYGEQLRAVLDHVVLAEYQCRYDWRDHKVQDLHDGVFYPTRFASPQRALIPLTPHESLIVYRPKSTRHLGQRPKPMQQLWLFELVRMA